jgi:hypothetical protein
MNAIIIEKINIPTADAATINKGAFPLYEFKIQLYITFKNPIFGSTELAFAEGVEFP